MVTQGLQISYLPKCKQGCKSLNPQQCYTTYILYLYSTLYIQSTVCNTIISQTEIRQTIITVTNALIWIFHVVWSVWWGLSCLQGASNCQADTVACARSNGFYRQADYRLEVCRTHTWQTETDLNTVYIYVKKSSASVVQSAHLMCCICWCVVWFHTLCHFLSRVQSTTSHLFLHETKS